MIALWRLGLAALSVFAVYFLTQPVMEVVLLTVRRRVGKRYRWVADIHRYLLVYISWITMCLLFLLIAVSLLDLARDNGIVQFISYAIIVPLVLATFALRIVVTNMVVRHFKWDRGSSENDTKIFVVTEAMKFLCFILILVEIFCVFFLGNQVASFLFLELFLGFEILLLFAGFTTLKNIATGLFLVFAEPFRTGSFCRVLHLRGFVEKVSLARTIMRRQDGALVYIPNGIFADSHQTSGNPSDAFQHEIVIRLRSSTPVEKIKQAREDLAIVLAEFSAQVEEDDASGGSVSGYRMSNMSSSVMESRLSAHRQSSSAVSDPQPQQKALYIGLSDMDSLKVRMTIDHALFSSLEVAKTEVNLAILQVFQDHRIQPLLLR